MPRFTDLDDMWAAWAASRARRDRDALVLASQPLIGATVARLNVAAPAWVDREDQVSSGQVGLLQAIDGYDPNLNVQFVYYAMVKIRGAILDGLRQTDWVPKRVRQATRDLAATEERLMHQLHRAPTDAEVAGALHLSIDDVHDMRTQAFQALVHSDGLVMRDSTGEAVTVTIDDQVHGPGSAADGDLEVATIREQVAQAVGRIRDPLHMQVLKLYYVDRLTMGEAAKVLGVSAGKFSKMRDAAITELQSGLGR